MTQASHQIALAWGVLAWGSFAGSAAAEARGRVLCEITENGRAASGTVSIVRAGDEIAAGTCGRELSVVPGAYTALVRLDGALDGPVQERPLVVQANAKLSLKVDFATGTLEIRIASRGKRAAGMAIIKQNGTQIGTLGSGVAAHLSAGTYQVVARYRAAELDLGQVSVGPGESVTRDAAFD